MIRHFLSRQFLMFLLTGGVAAMVNFASRIVLSFWLNYSSAVILAYGIGMLTAFLLARAFVFTDSSHSARTSAAWFVGVNLIAILQTWAVSMLLAYHILPALGVRRYVPEIAHAVGIIVPVFSSYLGHKYLSFGRPTRP